MYYWWGLKTVHLSAVVFFFFLWCAGAFSCIVTGWPLIQRCTLVLVCQFRILSFVFQLILKSLVSLSYPGGSEQRDRKESAHTKTRHTPMVYNSTQFWEQKSPSSCSCDTKAFYFHSLTTPHTHKVINWLQVYGKIHLRSRSTSALYQWFRKCKGIDFNLAQ